MYLDVRIFVMYICYNFYTLEKAARESCLTGSHRFRGKFKRSGGQVFLE